jgi:hypothetical protein
MTAIVQDRFGPPDTLQLVDVSRPEIGSGEVRLEVQPPLSTPTTGTWSAGIRASPA